jgi:predicted permease
VREEIRFYLEERTRELVANGLPEAEARRQAEEKFGDVARIEAEVRRVRRERERERGWKMRIGSLAQDFRIAARGFARRPGFTLVVVATLALGIGSVTAIFTVVNATMLTALPFEDADDLVFLQGAFDAPEGPQVRGGSPPEIRDWGSMSRSFEGVAAVGGHSATLTGADGPAERLLGEMIDEGYFDLTRVSSIRGRVFSADEYSSDAAAPVVIGETLWERRYGRDPALVGRSIVLNDQPFTVIGIMPEEFRGSSLIAEYWLPLVSIVGVDGLDARGGRWLNAIARLAPGVTLDAATQDIDGVTARLGAQYPDTNADRIALVTPMRQLYLGSTRTLLWVLLGATGLLLAIAAANVANLMLVRAESRRAETLMRRALGAGRATILRHTLVETSVLAAAGAVGGVLAGVLGVRLLGTVIPSYLLPSYAVLQPDATVFLVVLGIMAMVALGVGAVPHLVGGRTDLASGLRGEGGRTVGRGRVGNALVAGEVGLALMLLVGAGLMAQSLRAQLAVDPGFAYEELLAFSIQMPPDGYPDDATRLAGLRDLESRIEALAGVRDVTWGPDAAPLYGGSSAAFVWTNAGGGTDDRIRFYYHEVTPGWFETLGAELAAGRDFEASDVESRASAIVSQAFAARHFGTEDPVGRSLYLFDPENGPQFAIVGVAEDVRWRDLTTDLVEGATDPDVWVPFTGDSPNVEIVVRAAGDPADLVEAVTETVGAFDPDIAPLNLVPMSTSLGGLTAQARFGATLLGVFSALATLLAAVGLYGVLSFSVSGRAREIAVRMALGADRAAVQRMVVGDGLRVTAAGLVLGTVAAAFAARSLNAFLFGVAPMDLATYVFVAVLMSIVAAAAAWVPAVRATRTDPQRTLAGDG